MANLHSKFLTVFLIYRGLKIQKVGDAPFPTPLT